MELVRAYRLFGHKYLVLTIENRDPTPPWALDRSPNLPGMPPWNDTQRAELVAQYRRSGLTQDATCARHPRGGRRTVPEDPPRLGQQAGIAG